MDNHEISKSPQDHVEFCRQHVLEQIMPDPYEYSRVLRKVDWRVVPIMFACYFLQFLDKVVINYANIMGLQQDLGMKGNDFSMMATAFFIGFALAEIPQGYFLQKFPIARVLGLNMLCWAILVACTAAAQNYAQILAIRILLGCCEAIITPALVLMTSTWYSKRQAAPRYGVW
jgi:MFS family permease